MLNSAAPVASAEIQWSGSPGWLSGSFDSGLGEWTFGSFSPALVLPLSVRLTDTSSHSFEVTNLVTSLTDNAIFNTGQQFPAPGSSSIPEPASSVLLAAGLALLLGGVVLRRHGSTGFEAPAPAA